MQTPVRKLNLRFSYLSRCKKITTKCSGLKPAVLLQSAGLAGGLLLPYLVSVSVSHTLPNVAPCHVFLVS